MTKPQHSTAGLCAHPPLTPPYASVLSMIGNTPMLALDKLDTGPGARLFGKMELMNPAGSIKDRIGLSMIEAAEKDGRLNPKAGAVPTVIEATAGNTGLGLALVASQRGYNIKFVMPDKMSQEKIQHLRAMGAEVILTRSDVEKGHPEYYQDMAAALAKKIPNSVYINQFANPANPLAHYEGTGPEIWEQMRHVGGVDAFVCGVGSGGTLSGVGKFLREKNPDVKIVLADPAGSILAPLVNEGRKVKPGSWLVEGMGEDFVPDICDLKLVSEAFAVTDREAFLAARELLAKEGVLAGSSTGCILHAALAFCRKQKPRPDGRPMNVVTLICDSGAKYLSKMFNDFWMMDNGFIQREKTDDLRDLIARRRDPGEDAALPESAPTRNALFVGVQVDAVRVLGILDEGDILLAVHAEGQTGPDGPGEGTVFDRPVSDFMTRRLETISPEAPVSALMPIFRADRVVIVVDKAGKYFGLITKIDMINYLRQQLVR